MAIGLGSILFVDSEAGLPRQELFAVGTEKATSLLNDERVLKELLEIDTEITALR